MTEPKLTNNFYSKEQIRQHLIEYVRLSPRKKLHIKSELRKQEEAEANELLAWYLWWDEYHN